MKRKDLKKIGKVSIIVPVFNYEKLVVRCVDSLLNQTIKNKEVICVDDKSTDNSYEVLKRTFGKKIQLYKNPSKGKAKAINYALSKATGDFVFIADADAYYAGDYLEKLLPLLNKKGVGGAIGHLIVPNKDKSWFSKTAFLEREKKFKNYTPISAWLFRKKVLDELGGFDSRLRAHDEVILGRLMKKRGFKIGYADDALWYHNEKESLKQLFRQQVWWGKGYVDTLKYYGWVSKPIIINSFLALLSLFFAFFHYFLLAFFVWLAYLLFLVFLTSSFSIAVLKFLRGLFQTVGFWKSLIFYN